MRHVYHHFGDPAAMNASIRETLKPGGRLAVIDFGPDEGRSRAPSARASGKGHGGRPSSFLVLARKPAR